MTNPGLVLDEGPHKVRITEEGTIEKSSLLFLSYGNYEYFKETGEWTDWTPANLLSFLQVRGIIGDNAEGWYFVYRLDDYGKFVVFDMREQLLPRNIGDLGE